MIDLLKSQALAFIVVIILAALCQLFFRSAKSDMTEEKLANRLKYDEPDFHPVEWIIDEKNGKALTRNSQGEIALMQTAGANLVVRRMLGATLKSQHNDRELILSSSDHTFRSLKITASTETEAGKWAALISGAQSE
ncbi:MAG: hypothetical protein ACSHXY_05865 [Alphaproteobacteria bacterium]